MSKTLTSVGAGCRALAVLAFLAMPFVAAPPAQGETLDDGAIIAIYNHVNGIDIETALLGQIMGHSEEVRALAAMVATDHTNVRKAAHDLANSIGVVPDLPAQRADAALTHYRTIASLRELEGAAFDQAYLENEIAFHTAAISALRGVLLPAAKNDALKAHLESVLPHFDRHLADTIGVAESLGYR